MLYSGFNIHGFLMSLIPLSCVSIPPVNSLTSHETDWSTRTADSATFTCLTTCLLVAQGPASPRPG